MKWSSAGRREDDDDRAGNDRYSLATPEGVPLLEGRVGEMAKGNGVTIDVTKLVARPGTRFEVLRANDLDAIAAFQSGITVVSRASRPA